MTREFVRRIVPLPCSVDVARAAAPFSLAFIVSATVHATPVPTANARDQAIVHFNAGNEAFTRGDTHEAYRQYRTAWELHRTFDIACNLGRAEAELGKLPQAAGHLAYCLDHFSSSPQQDLRDARQRYSELFDTVRAQVSSLRLTVEPDGAEVFLNGASIGTTPLGGDVFVLPGRQIVELKSRGYHELRREIPAFAGETRSLQLRLEAIESVPEPAAPGSLAEHGGSGTPPLDATPTSVSSRSIALVSGVVLTAAGAGVGLGFYLQGAKLDDEAAVQRERIQAASASDPNPCAMSSDGACAQLANTLDRRDQAWTVSTVGFISMGVFGLGTLATWVWWPDRPSTATSARPTTFTPVITSQLLGATVSGTL